MSFSDFFSEDLVHHCLECGRQVGEAKEHDPWFEETTICFESGLPLIPWENVDIVVAPPNVKLCEDGCIL